MFHMEPTFFIHGESTIKSTDNEHVTSNIHVTKHCLLCMAPICPLLPILPATRISYIWDTQNSFLHVEISIQVAVHLPTNDLVCIYLKIWSDTFALET